MPKLRVFLLACFAFTLDLSASDLLASKLILDRGPSSESNLSAGLAKQTEGFLADDFQVGAAPEVWVIDHIRLWAVPDPKATSHHSLGDLFNKISLYGGIAPDPPVLDPKAHPECDCHNLPAVKTSALKLGSDSTDDPDVVVSSSRQHDGSDIWQIDFENLRWSVPGATSIQFGVLAEGRQVRDSDSSYSWYYAASPAADGQHLRVFSSAGKLQRPFHEGGAASVNIQVWGHLLAKISIRPAGQKLRVVLLGQQYLEASQVDRESLRFGPGNVAPGPVQTEDSDHDGKLDLVMYFRTGDAGLPPKSVNACLSGRRLDGAPFEGCDLLAH
jgi:hypothetical protein